MKGLKQVTGNREPIVEVDPRDVEILSPKNQPKTPESSGKGIDKLASAAADSFPKILMIAESIVEMKKIQVQSDAVIKQMEEQRKNLIAETESYVMRKNADTNDVVEKMKIVRDMMNDFYKNSGNSNISGEDFRIIISEIVTNMNKV